MIFSGKEFTHAMFMIVIYKTADENMALWCIERKIHSVFHLIFFLPISYKNISSYVRSGILSLHVVFLVPCQFYLEN